MIERVKEIINVKAKSVREFSKMINIKQVTLNQQLTGTRSLSLDIIVAILNSFEDISAEWLLRGKGSMYLSKSEINENKIINSNKIEIIKLQTENKLLREIVGIQGNKNAVGGGNY